VADKSVEGEGGHQGRRRLPFYRFFFTVFTVFPFTAFFVKKTGNSLFFTIYRTFE
jgi:hypothetical protein